jgi:hypothetical protein
MAFAPGPNLVLVANNADMPAFGTLVNASTGAAVATHITIPGQIATGGLEQPVWDPNTGTFFISVPTFNGSDPGGVAEISTTGTVLRQFHFDTLSAGGVTSCSPTGLALGGSGNLMVGCGNAGTQTIVLDPAANGGNGAIKTLLSQISGSDELWYDPATGDFYVTGSNAGNRIFDIFNDRDVQPPAIGLLGAVDRQRPLDRGRSRHRRRLSPIARRRRQYDLPARLR